MNVTRLDHLREGEAGRLYRVATFAHSRSTGTHLVTAYTRDYNEQWEGCELFDVLAVDGRRAKMAAAHYRRERLKPGGKCYCLTCKTARPA